MNIVTGVMENHTVELFKRVSSDLARPGYNNLIYLYQTIQSLQAITRIVGILTIQKHNHGVTWKIVKKHFVIYPNVVYYKLVSILVIFNLFFINKKLME